MANFFYLAQLKTTVTEVLMKKLLFADDAAFVAHSKVTLQTVISSMARTCFIYIYKT